MNSWFNPTGEPITRSAGSSNTLRTLFSAIAQAFDMLPDPLGPGQRGFSQPTLQDPTLIGGTMRGGQVGEAAHPTDIIGARAFLGAGAGYAAGALPVLSGTLGAFFRMAGTSRVGYARSDSGTPVTSFFFDEFRSLVMGNAAAENATTATEGFLYIPTCNGPPTGAPAAYTGAVPIIYDRANNRLYARSGGTWRQVALT